MVQKKKTRVFLTGGFGNWGQFALRSLAEAADKVDVVALILPSDYEKHSDLRKEFNAQDNLEIVIGDLVDYETVKRCVDGADYVIHLGGMVSPVADANHWRTHQVNVGAVRNIIRAVKEQPNPDEVGVVGVGSVAQTGDRNPPHHWGRVGDPLWPSKYEEYAQSKIIAENMLIHSGLKKWAWLRSSGIFHPGVVRIMDPIMTHTTMDGVLEWILVEDAARLVRKIVTNEDVDPRFWRGVYNLGSGEPWRFTNYELYSRIVALFGADMRKWYNFNWYANRNFHGQWYTDSDWLEELVPYRSGADPEKALQRMKNAAPAVFNLAGAVPGQIVKQLGMRPILMKNRGILKFIQGKDPKGMGAYFGGYDEWKKIGTWKDYAPAEPSREPTYLDHGYDESKKISELTVEELQKAAEFRGGKLLSTEYSGDEYEPLRWAGAFGHEFDASPFAVLKAGHWCPKDVRNVWQYEAYAERSPFLAQLELS
ncbi:MAG: NAD(P)-dependent oxidoreductase [Lawsonella sp.]